MELHSAFKSWGIGDRVVYMIFGISHMLLAAHRARRRAAARAKKALGGAVGFVFIT